jgi:hypothetical protein
MSLPAHVGKCVTCGKLRFKSRKAAKKYVILRFPNDRMSVYRCGNYFHFGHTPRAVNKGAKARSRN